MFNVGDRVMYVGNNLPSYYGCYGTIEAEEPGLRRHFVDFDDGRTGYILAESLKLVLEESNPCAELGTATYGLSTTEVERSRIGDDEPAINGAEFEARMLRLWEK